jgi:D-ribose pyranase
MRRSGILNQRSLNATGALGHTDHIVIADAGLPIDLGVERIDLTVVKGMPKFLDVLAPVMAEVIVEKMILAKEIVAASPAMYESIRQLAGSIPIELVSHEEFKALSRKAKAIVRTGEFTAFSNVILQSGVEGFSEDSR